MLIDSICEYICYIWYLLRHDKSRRPGVLTTAAAGSDANLPLRIKHNLGKWDSRMYGFYSSVDDPLCSMQHYREKQRDTCQYPHDGPLAATDGSLSLRKERMGTNFVRVRTSMRNLLDGDNMGHLSPRDGAPNKALLKSVTAVDTMQAAELHSIIFVREALLRPDTGFIRETVAKSNDPNSQMNDVWDLPCQCLPL